MDTNQLLERVARGESAAADALLTRHRARLHRMVCLRFDPRLASRVDPSDIVQEAMTEAHRRLPAFAAERPMAFYPWLRRIAWDRLLQTYRHHVQAQRRSLLREERLPLSQESELQLAERLAAQSAAPDRLLRSEIRQRVRRAIGQLRPADHEIIVLKHLEELSFPEVAEILEVSVAAAHSRYYRAIKKLHQLLQDEG